MKQALRSYHTPGGNGALPYKLHQLSLEAHTVGTATHMLMVLLLNPLKKEIVVQGEQSQASGEGNHLDRNSSPRGDAPNSPMLGVYDRECTDQAREGIQSARHVQLVQKPDVVIFPPERQP